MKRGILGVLVFLITILSTYAVCDVPTDAEVISANHDFCEGNFNLASGINVDTPDLVLTCNTTIFNGTGGSVGINLFTNAENTTIDGCIVNRYGVGFDLDNVENLTIINNRIENKI